jgi:hypothetical protein
VYFNTGLCSISIILCILIQLVHASYRFIKDINEGNTIWYYKYEAISRKFTIYDDYGDFTLNMLVSLVISFFMVLLWPLLDITVIYFGFLLGLRHLFRFKTKVSTALNGKANKDHTH